MIDHESGQVCHRSSSATTCGHLSNTKNVNLKHICTCARGEYNAAACKPMETNYTVNPVTQRQECYAHTYNSSDYSYNRCAMFIERNTGFTCEQFCKDAGMTCDGFISYDNHITNAPQNCAAVNAQTLTCNATLTSQVCGCYSN